MSTNIAYMFHHSYFRRNLRLVSPLNVPLCLNRSSAQQNEANWFNMKSDISSFCQWDRRLDYGRCLLFVCAVDWGPWRDGFTVSCLIKQSKDWPNSSDEQPCWCCVLSTNMTLLVGLSLQRTDSTFRYIVWFTDIDRKGWLRLCNSTICSGKYYSSN
jgi:hypothetical protein